MRITYIKKLEEIDSYRRLKSLISNSFRMEILRQGLMWKDIKNKAKDKEIGIGLNSISNIVNGKINSLSAMFIVAEVLDCDIEFRLIPRFKEKSIQRTYDLSRKYEGKCIIANCDNSKDFAKFCQQHREEATQREKERIIKKHGSKEAYDKYTKDNKLKRLLDINI